jgi:GTPase SAR1 family protein
MSNLKDSVKILILGPAGIGKTTLRKIFFDQDNPFELIQKTLEPTINVEINSYPFDSNIAVYDLAGQQLEEWLHESQDVFVGCDLIICVLDCREVWEKNYDLWKRIALIKNDFCPDSELLLLFHKIDLIDEVAQDKLREQIQEVLPEFSSTYFGLTSINPKYYLNTLNLFIFALEKYQNPFQLMQVNKSLFKAEILEIISKFQPISIINVYNLLKIPLFNFRMMIEELSNNQFLLQETQTNLLSLTELGRITIEEFKSQIVESIGDYLELHYYFFNEKEQIRMN